MSESPARTQSRTLPSDGWNTRALSEIAKIQYGYTESATSEPVGPKFLRITDIQEEAVNWDSVPFCPMSSSELPKFQLKSDDIVFARTGASTGKSFRVVEPPLAVFASYLIRLRLETADVLPEFVSYYFQTKAYWAAVAEGSAGSAQGGFNASKLGAMQLPIPPRPEQERIVAILDEAFANIAIAKANTETAHETAGKMVEAELESIFEKGNPSWKQFLMTEICSIDSKLVDPRDPAHQNLLHVGAGNIESKTGELIGLMTAKEEGLISGKFRFDQTAVLYSKIRPYLMKVARPSFEGLCSADMYPLTPNLQVITRSLLFHLLLSQSFTRFAIEGSARAGMPKVNRDHLFGYRCALPPIEKQDEISAKLDSLCEESARMVEILCKKLLALDELKKSVLHQAFSGLL